MKFRLIPSNDEFFVLFSKAADNLAATTRALAAVVGDLSNGEALHEEVRQCERTGDELTRALLHELDTSFVTPFDREDVHMLAEQIDDVIDDIYHLSGVLVLIPVDPVLPEFREQVELLQTLGTKVVDLLSRMDYMKGLRPILEEIDRLEGQGDELYRRALKQMFSGSLDAIDVIKWKDLIDAAEDAIDGIEDIADIVATIAFKHA